ncbi:calmodulin-binding receptor-like cytoplasmic kinase 3 [Herrania umbratica]|uniref:non-specific serine/threonine protein kinase n=1 Tax=Herrania umbratica TaxID=108875 RepID=A0A6J0ZTD7_9ROSI|nr:calmodulin-binding receptor-like cytoplasmic kinase 3 [Herrania umbratica]XP_021277582.1 calmodulin-binding receptor-like cytoplasmic kinase 3 [Herrania umbratica]XP_021277583.1 calmodulin-binding receptor-like cytoplasmic kinase 3 [Herrania umbratica]XP_021277584.1 calmodulin-binding receptor-like cytoplasmic kinase 3 [Herrania umbratica]XP_021277585.1 calmodulin-binding receptor-like cytoplasmic kinase 3 [Herrania umbratica]
MGVECLNSPRMAASIFSLLLFMQLSRFFASGLEVKSKICGADDIAYSNLYGHELFYLNGNLVDKVLFCKALQLHYADDCVFEGYTGTDDCGLDLSLADLSLGGGRELLQEHLKEHDEHDEPALKPKDKNKRKYSVPTKVGMVAAGILLTCCVFICPCFYRKKRATAHTVLEKDPNSMDSASALEMSVHSPPAKVPASPLRVPPSPSRFSMSPKLSRIGSVHLNMTQVARATCNFSSALQIGEGGFGTVYKAQLDSGQVVAIKRAKKEHFENLRTEFSSEVELLAKIDHRSLVKLLGYVDKGNERLIITEYVPNGTLRDHLDGQRGKILDFNQRLEIAIDVAHGLTYLHLYAEKPIIHRDVKSSNILLTESMRAKVADFGFARLGPMDSDQTHISTKVKGTVGYLDPEYMKTYQLTPKSDVYSFGILLIEILTGRRPVELRRPVEERVTLRWAFHKYNDGHVVELVDPAMGEVVDAEILEKMFALAFQCAAPIRNDRPDMKSVAEQLWAIRADYLKGSRQR